MFFFVSVKISKFLVSVKYTIIVIVNIWRPIQKIVSRHFFYEKPCDYLYSVLVFESSELCDWSTFYYPVFGNMPSVGLTYLKSRGIGVYKKTNLDFRVGAQNLRVYVFILLLDLTENRCVNKVCIASKKLKAVRTNSPISIRITLNVENEIYK